jgi:hypothetical protein
MVYESSRIFLIREKSPFIFFDGGEEEKLEIFPLHHHQKICSNPLGAWRGLFDELLKSSG